MDAACWARPCLRDRAVCASRVRCCPCCAAAACGMRITAGLRGLTHVLLSFRACSRPASCALLVCICAAEAASSLAAAQQCSSTFRLQVPASAIRRGSLQTQTWRVVTFSDDRVMLRRISCAITRCARRQLPRGHVHVRSHRCSKTNSDVRGTVARPPPPTLRICATGRPRTRSSRSHAPRSPPHHVLPARRGGCALARIA
jgi:hypothetical protein